MARRTKRRPRAKTPLRRSRVQSAVGTASGQSTATAVGAAIATGVGTSASKRSKSPSKRVSVTSLIQQLAAKQFLGGYYPIPTKTIMKKVNPELKEQAGREYSVSTFQRALGRRPSR